MLRRTPFPCTPSSFLARYTLRWFATVAIAVPTTAHAQQPNLDGITQLVTRFEQGNEAVRGRLETEARGLMRHLVSRTPTLEELRVAARVGIALGDPFAAPGEYRLEVTITSPSGEVVRREHPVMIVVDADIRRAGQ